MKVMVGGTFDYLHIGHQLLLERAFMAAGASGEVIIGLSADVFAARKSHPVRSYDVRKQELIHWIVEKKFSARYVIEPLFDSFGSALTIDFDVLVVSYETFSVGNLINDLRKKAGRPMVDIYQIECVMADDGKAVSSTRICKGEINRYGEAVPRCGETVSEDEFVA